MNNVDIQVFLLHSEILHHPKREQVCVTRSAQYKSSNGAFNVLKLDVFQKFWLKQKGASQFWSIFLFGSQSVEKKLKSVPMFAVKKLSFQKILEQQSGYRNLIDIFCGRTETFHRETLLRFKSLNVILY